MAQKIYRLLFVDDELDAEPYLVIPFEDAGFEVDTATNGADAEHAFRSGVKYDAIILDNMMAPGEDPQGKWNFDVVKNGLHTGLLFLGMMAEACDSPPPVWVVTGFPDAEVETKEREFAFVVDVIRKPHSLELLAAEIIRYLSERGAGGDLANA